MAKLLKDNKPVPSLLSIRPSISKQTTLFQWKTLPWVLISIPLGKLHDGLLFKSSTLRWTPQAFCAFANRATTHDVRAMGINRLGRRFKGSSQKWFAHEIKPSMSTCTMILVAENRLTKGRIMHALRGLRSSDGTAHRPGYCLILCFHRVEG